MCLKSVLRERRGPRASSGLTLPRVASLRLTSQSVVLFSFGFSESPGSCFLYVFKLVSYLSWWRGLQCTYSILTGTRNTLRTLFVGTRFSVVQDRKMCIVLVAMPFNSQRSLSLAFCFVECRCFCRADSVLWNLSHSSDLSPRLSSATLLPDGFCVPSSSRSVFTFILTSQRTQCFSS